jgi:hypothetical protein
MFVIITVKRESIGEIIGIDIANTLIFAQCCFVAVSFLLRLNTCFRNMVAERGSEDL